VNNNEFEGSGREQAQRHLGETEENYENHNQDIWCSGQESNQVIS
jgi:hypothetical protein